MTYPHEPPLTSTEKAFEVWLTDQFRDAGCEIRTLSPEGMAAVTVDRFRREGWTVQPPQGEF